MSHLFRRKPFIVVQELNTLKNTQDLLVSKINFLINQLLFWMESVNRQDLVSPEFKKGLFLCIGLRVKILQILSHLSNSSNLYWDFLQTLSVNDQRPYIFGNLKMPGFIIDTDSILLDTGSYFLNLLGLGVIDIETWKNLTNLKNRNSIEGGFSISDTCYYEFKKTSILDSVENLDVFDQFDREFNIFMSKPIKLHNPAPVLYCLFKETIQKKNHTVIRNLLSYYKFNYVAIRKDKEFKKGVDNKQHRHLMDSLSNLRSFSDLYRSVSEFKVMDKTDSVKGLFSCILEYFFSQDQSVFDFEISIYEEKCFTEKMARATLWLDFILCICENSVNCSFSRTLSYDTTYKNFVKSCEIELSVLKDAKSIHLMMLFDFDSIELVIKKITQLKSNAFYRRHYSRIIDKYLDFRFLKKT